MSDISYRVRVTQEWGYFQQRFQEALVVGMYSISKPCRWYISLAAARLDILGIQKNSATELD